MLDTVFLIVYAMIAISLLLNLWRLIAGPSVPDRILALDTMFINTIALIILYGMSMDTGLYFEAALLIAMLGFVSTVAVCKYLLRGDILAYGNR
jgi:multicomponent K+:H+ antiporter subunit F